MRNSNLLPNQKTMSKKKIVTITTILVVWLIIWYKWYSMQNALTQAKIEAKIEASKYEMLLSEPRVMSEIESDRMYLDTARLDFIKYWNLEAEYKENKEKSKWLERCLEKKLIWEVDHCNNLEEYAVYVK